MLSRSPIQFHSSLFLKIARLLQGASMPVDKWFIRLGTETYKDNKGNPASFRRTIYPIRHDEVSPEDNMHIEKTTGVAIVIDSQSVRRWDGTVVDELNMDAFLNVIRQSIEERKRRDDKIFEYAAQNKMDRIMTHNGMKMNGVNLVDFCSEHDIAYDIRHGCPGCQGGIALKLDDEQKKRLEEAGRKLRPNR